jgi:hypothetical protein
MRYIAYQYKYIGNYIVVWLYSLNTYTNSILFSL